VCGVSLRASPPESSARGRKASQKRRSRGIETSRWPERRHTTSASARRRRWSPSAPPFSRFPLGERSRLVCSRGARTNVSGNIIFCDLYVCCVCVVHAVEFALEDGSGKRSPRAWNGGKTYFWSQKTWHGTMCVRMSVRFVSGGVCDVKIVVSVK
jgi:hypothetical protein